MGNVASTMSKVQPKNIFSFLLRLFCLSIVLYEIYQGTEKYLLKPTATKVVSKQTEIPTLSICHRYYDLRIAPIYGVNFTEYRDGKFFPDNFENLNKTVDDLFNDSFDDGYYLFDVTVKKSHCKTELSNGQYLRQYIGNENMTENGTACLNWITVTEAEKLIGVDHVGDHNYCRNPNKTQDREFCYISQNVTEFCRVRTCDSVEVLVDTSQGYEQIISSGTTYRNYQKCASFDLHQYVKDIGKVRVRSPFDVNIYSQ